ncbi:MAG: caspase family protein, partial [Magnetococcales bacterium]|nr:caspase family protein [Magnetococcales bacterium]
MTDLSSGPTTRILLLSSGNATRGFARVEPKSSAAGEKPGLPSSEFTADGERRDRPQLVTGDGDGAVTLWDTVQNTRIRTLHGLDEEVIGLAVLPGGRLLATGKKGSLKIWHLDSGESAEALPGLGRDIRELSVAPSGRQAAVVADDGQLLLLDLATGKTVVTLAERDGVALAWSPDGASVAGVLAGGSLIAWNVADGAEKWRTKEDFTPKVMAFSLDGRYLAVADDANAIRVWTVGTGGGGRGFGRVDPTAAKTETSQPDAASSAATDATDTASPGPPQLLQGSQKGINALAFAPGGQGILASAGDDRMVRFWSGSRGVEITRLVAMRTGWAAVTPEGFFDGTLDGETEDRLDAISWDVDNRSFSVDGFLESYYRPGLLGHLLAGEKMSTGTLPNVSEGFTPPPKVTLELGENDPANHKITILATVEDQGSGVDEVRLFHNGKVIDPDLAEETGRTRSAQNEIRKLRFTVPMVAGSNSFQGLALSRDRIESETASILFNHPDEDPGAASLHLLVVGINNYKNRQMNLNFGVPDAKGVRDFFTTARISAASRTLVDTLFDAHATREAITQRLDLFKNTAPQDTVVIYLAGHGEAEKDAWYFIPHEVDFSDVGRLQSVAVSSALLKQSIARIGARNVVLMLDACKSGAAVGPFSGLAEHRPMATLSRATGTHVVAASTGTQLANELDLLGHGVFTYALLKGLKGASDTSPHDNRIQIKELMTYLRTQVPILTRQYKTGLQDPVINMRGENFT